MTKRYRPPELRPSHACETGSPGKTVSLLATAVLLIACGSGAESDRDRPRSNASAQPSAMFSPSPTMTADGETSISPTPQQSSSPIAPGDRAARNVIRGYYDSINARNYRKAFELWSGKGETSNKSFEEFRDGYQDTESVDVDMTGDAGRLEGAAGSQYITIAVRLKAQMRSGEIQKFTGKYTLRRSMVDGATPEQRLWRIFSAEIKRSD
jgi:hypothetical protein